MAASLRELARERVAELGGCGWDAGTRICVLPKGHPGKHGTEPPDRRCSWCGLTDQDNEEAGYGPLTDVQVIIAYGEEGHAAPRRWLCQDHLVEVSRSLAQIGFGVHRHGGINFLEPVDCPGYHRMDDCPVPVPEDDPTDGDPYPENRAGGEVKHGQ